MKKSVTGIFFVINLDYNYTTKVMSGRDSPVSFILKAYPAKTLIYWLRSVFP